MSDTTKEADNDVPMLDVPVTSESSTPLPSTISLASLVNNNNANQSPISSNEATPSANSISTPVKQESDDNAVNDDGLSLPAPNELKRKRDMDTLDPKNIVSGQSKEPKENGTNHDSAPIPLHNPTNANGQIVKTTTPHLIYSPLKTGYCYDVRMRYHAKIVTSNFDYVDPTRKTPPHLSCLQGACRVWNHHRPQARGSG